MNDQTQESVGFEYKVWVPTQTPNGQSVSVESEQRLGRNIMHAESPDQSEFYFEVFAYERLMDHNVLVREQQEFLRENSHDGTCSEAWHGTLYHLEGTIFDFNGTLQNRWKVRKFLFVDGSNRTYRIVHDPTSELNIQALQTLQLERRTHT